jgi:hypothetical protein
LFVILYPPFGAATTAAFALCADLGLFRQAWFRIAADAAQSANMQRRILAAEAKLQPFRDAFNGSFTKLANRDARLESHQWAYALSLAETSAPTGLNKTTILRSIKNGRLTGTKDPLGQWQVAWSRAAASGRGRRGSPGERDTHKAQPPMRLPRSGINNSAGADNAKRIS